MSVSREMPEVTSRTAVRRGSLSRAAVVQAALDLADAEGLEAVTMRAIAQRLGCKPMSLYRHVADKDALLDALVESIFAEYELPDPTQRAWREELARRAGSVRRVLVRHPWALALLETRAGPDRPVTFAHAEAVLATLVEAGCSPRTAATAFVMLDSYVYGFALQQITLPSTEPEVTATDEVVQALQEYPTMLAVMEAVAGDPDYEFSQEFDVGLEVVLDGIERWRDADAASHHRPQEREDK